MPLLLEAPRYHRKQTRTDIHRWLLEPLRTVQHFVAFDRRRRPTTFNNGVSRLALLMQAFYARGATNFSEDLGTSPEHKQG